MQNGGENLNESSKKMPKKEQGRHFKPNQKIKRGEENARNKIKYPKKEGQSFHNDKVKHHSHNKGSGNKEFHQSNMELKRSVEINAKIHQNTLTVHSQTSFNPDAKVRITPLGGLGEIGANMTVMETPNSAIIIDAGMSFPDDNMHGVDILVPDFSYLEAIKDKIVGIVITHAHEDHIGAMPFLFKKY
ncbi:MAG: MBL fold metallo-hydrolase, partial [Helicobacter sp.]|nr:MBL fold metallo-hydrolase [Helicobacter sp.]